MKYKEYKILIIDDEEEITQSLKKLLELEGFSVETVNDSQVALEKVENSFFHVILTDIMMPGVDGFDILRAVRKKFPSTQVIMMTGYASIENAINAVHNGAQDYIIKPFESVDFVIEIIKGAIYCYSKNERIREAVKISTKFK